MTLATMIYSSYICGKTEGRLKSNTFLPLIRAEGIPKREREWGGYSHFLQKMEEPKRRKTEERRVL
jgi:hypothetical protein